MFAKTTSLIACMLAVSTQAAKLQADWWDIDCNTTYACECMADEDVKALCYMMQKDGMS